jgi:aldehyde dehydrogenase (NAD+)
VTDHRLLIGGELRPASGAATYDNLSPVTGKVLGTAPDASTDDMAAAVGAARDAFDHTAWATDHALRAHCLRQLHQALVEHTDELTELTIAEVGAPRSMCATVQLAIPVDFLRHYADLLEGYEWRTDLGVADTIGGPARRWTEREPVGVVAAITPWNVPTQINLAKLAPALAAGCTTVLKPAPDTPWLGLVLGRLVAEHTDIPAGVVNVVTGSSSELGEALTTDPRVDMISFTGSTATGRRIMAVAAERVVKVFLELGGKSALVVLDDVEDLSGMALPAAFGSAAVAGQGCALSTRILLPRARYDEGVEALADMLAMLPPGDPDDAATMMGPLISPRQWERVDGLVQQGLAEGARLVCGGRRPAGLPDGNFYEQTLLADVTSEMTVAQEEIFGPVLVAIPHDGDDDAVRIANDSIYGLSGHVYSADEDRALAVGRRIRTGTLSINGGVWYGADVPFGGVKQSGIGREMGLAGFEEYLEIKSYAAPT